MNEQKKSRRGIRSKSMEEDTILETSESSVIRYNVCQRSLRDLNVFSEFITEF
jgi:hypothetical protein